MRGAKATERMQARNPPGRNEEILNSMKRTEAERKTQNADTSKTNFVSIC
jgi:hypothetical protein